MKKIVVSILTLLPAFALAANFKMADHQIKAELKQHFLKYHDEEYFSGIAVSVYKPGQEIKNYYIGNVSHAENSAEVGADTLFEIGSITKSFTAALVLKLEKQRKLHMQDTLHMFLPDYTKWADISIEKMLNMTSGLPNYSDSPVMNTTIFQDMGKVWSDKELIDLSYPAGKFNPPMKSGYFYTNTGYRLIAMIIEKQTQHSFKMLMENTLIKPLQLNDTFYPGDTLDASVYKRLAHGYSYNLYDNPESLGRDVKDVNLSWAGSAGAIISTPEDIVKWVKALFVSNEVLDPKQKQQLMTLNSTQSGKHIKQVTPEDKDGFGLGVAQGYNPAVGVYWFYEGETLGYRALYLYSPRTGVIIAAVFNSAVNSENDHGGELMTSIYKLIA